MLLITKKTTSREKRILKRVDRVLPLALSAINVDDYSKRYLTIYQRHDTDWTILEKHQKTHHYRFYISVNDIPWAHLRSLKDKIVIKKLEDDYTGKYFYNKRCKVCQSVYYQKEISSEQFDVFSGNDNINVSYVNGAWTGEIMSCCYECSRD